MKLLLSTAVVCLMPMAGIAQTPPAPTGAPAVAAKFNLDTPIEALVADAKAKAVLDADLPGLTAHPSYDMFKMLSLRAVQPMSGGKLTDEALKKVETDLAAIR